MKAAETLQDAFNRGEINRMSFDVANEGLFSANATKEANSRSPETVAVLEPLKMFPWWAWARRWSLDAWSGALHGPHVSCWTGVV